MEGHGRRWGGYAGAGERPTLRFFAAGDQAFNEKDYVVTLQILAELKTVIDAFFDHVMVNVEDGDLRANRLALLKQLQQIMNRVADISRLAS